MRVVLTVVPVTIRHGDGTPTAVGMRADDGSWGSVELAQGQSGHDAAMGLLNELTPLDFRTPWQILPEPVAFTADGTNVQLLYTAGVPMIWADEDLARSVGAAIDSAAPWGDRWEPLTQLNDTGERVRSPYPLTKVFTHWRNRLEERTAAVLFLPQYFTMKQLMDVYKAFWGKTSSGSELSNFHRWAKLAFDIRTPQEPSSSREDPLLEELSDDELQATRELIVERITEATKKAVGKDATNWAVSIAQEAWNATEPGLAAYALAKKAETNRTPGAPLEALGLAALSGATVSLAARSRGPKPRWYQSTIAIDDAKRGNRTLNRIYEPRPDLRGEGPHPAD